MSVSRRCCGRRANPACVAGFILLLFAASAPDAHSDPAPVGVATGLWRTADGTWLAPAHDPSGVWLWSSGEHARSDRLTHRVPLVGAAGTAPLVATGPVSAAFCTLDASDRIHLAWMAGDTLYYARCAAGDLADGGAWRSPMGGPAPDVVARDVVPRACAVAAGARPTIAGERDGGVVVLRFDGTWRETFTSAQGSCPVMVRGDYRELHLAFASPDGIRYHSSPDGERWLPREVPLSGRIAAGPALALLGGRPVVAGVVDGRAAIATRDGDWSRRALQSAAGVDTGVPHLGVDRQGGAWCAWAAGGRVHAARWLGEMLGPTLPIGVGKAVLVVEQAPPAAAADLGLLADVGGLPCVLRLPSPGLALLDETPARFYDLLDIVEMRGMAREAAAPAEAGSLPAPASGALLPAGLATCGKGGRGLRAWYSLPEEGRHAGYTAEWTKGRWGKPVPLTLASPRAWLRPPEGQLSVIRDDDEPDASRRYKMAAESAGPAAALLTSPDGLSWAYYAELPALRPLSLVRDAFARAEERWKLFGALGGGGPLAHFSSPDREHWYRQEGFELPATDATFWTEEGNLLGLADGGRFLHAARRGCPVVPVTDRPALAGGQSGRVFAPPIVWNGQWRLFIAEPDAWRWVAAPVGRWVWLTAAETDRPGVCVTVPVALVRADRRLRVDVRTRGSRGGVRVEVLDAGGRPVPGYVAHVAHADGWRGVSWGRGRALWRLEMASFRLRFTVDPGACLYGFRFAE